MKKIGNILAIAFCCIMAAVSFNSCIESEDYSIDPETYKQYMTDMAGQYSGRVRFYYAKNTATGVEAAKYDSTDTYWTSQKDSTVTIYRFPISKLDSAIVTKATDNSENTKMLRELHSQMRSLPDVTLKSYFFIPSKQAITSQYVQFYVNPWYAETAFQYEGKTKKVYFIFQQNTYSGVWTPTKHTFEYQLGLYAICFDKPEVNSSSAVLIPTLREVVVTCEAK